jgi:SMC interacting uncharacterized protein involved in chromosome segregation
MTKKIKYEKRNIFPYGEVLIPIKKIDERSLIEKYNDSIDIAEDRIEEASKGLNYESGWLTKAIVDKIKNYDKRKKEKEKELLKLDIEIEQLKKKLNGIKK